MPIALKSPKEISPDSLQSPYDAEVTYSGHKRKRYEVQVAATWDEESVCQIFIMADATPSSGGDTDVTVPAIDALTERNARPDELFAWAQRI